MKDAIEREMSALREENRRLRQRLAVTESGPAPLSGGVSAENDAFRWRALPAGTKQFIFAAMSMQDLLLLQEAVHSDEEVAAEVSRRITGAKPLWAAWAAKRRGAVDSSVAMDPWTDQSRLLDTTHLWNLSHIRIPSSYSRMHYTSPSAFMNMRLMDLRQVQCPLSEDVWAGLFFLAIECLALAENGLKTLPKSLPSSCPYLRGLSIASNDFETFPTPVLGLTNLEYLTISDNPKLRMLPESLGTLLPNLRAMYASSCSLTDIPQSLLDLVYPEHGRLQELVLNENLFSEDCINSSLGPVQRDAWKTCRYVGWNPETFLEYQWMKCCDTMKSRPAPP